MILKLFMNKLVVILFSCLIFSISFAQTIKLHEETPLKVKITQALSSKNAKVGDILSFKISEQVKVNEVVLIDTNAVALGEVIEAERSRSLGRPGKLDFIVKVVNAVDGQPIKLRVNSKKIAGRKTTGGVVAAAIIFSPLVLFIKGKNVTIEEGKEFLVYIDSDYQIAIK